MEDRVDCQIEYGEELGLSLCDTPVPFEGLPMIYACYGHNDKAVPILEDLVEGLVPHNIPFEDVWTSILIQCIVSLMEIGKYLI